MEILLRIRVSLNLLLFITIASCRTVVECEYGKYRDANAEECLRCSPCPEEVIRGESPFFAPLAACKKFISLCPKWCSVETGGLVSNPDVARGACPTTTPSPPVPFVNVTINEPQYNASTRTYAASCTMFFSNMDTPVLEWYGPSGQLLATSDTSGKWKVTQGDLTQEVMTQDVVTQGVRSTSLLINDFQQEDEGNYLCLAHGVQGDNQTIFLEYVEPPVITSTSPPTTLSSSSPPPPPNTAKSDDTSKPKGAVSTTMLVVVVVLSGVIIISCALFAIYLRRQRCSSRSMSEDIEKLPLTDLKSKLSLETSDFQSATIVGIQACLDHPDCAAVIITQNEKEIKKVRNIEDEDQNSSYISDVSWNDKLVVWMKYKDRKRKPIKTLRMFCLKKGNVTVTSAVINCPPVDDKFFLRYGEKNVSFGPVEPMQAGCKEIHDLRPDVNYCVELGIRGQTGGSGPYDWCWKDEFTTKCLAFQSVKIKDSSAKLRLAADTLPSSLELHYMVNSFDESQLKKMESPDVDLKDLIPGMDQVVQLKVKEKKGSFEQCRLLQEYSFKTPGHMKYGGDYDDDTTTDAERVNTRKKTKRNRRTMPKECTPKECTTGLWEALHNLRVNPKSLKFYNRPDRVMSGAIMECLLQVFTKYTKTEPVRPESVKKLDDVEAYLREKNMFYTGIFDILRGFIQLEEVHTQLGIDLANHFLDAHSRRCPFCEHACFLLQWYTNKKHVRSSES